MHLRPRQILLLCTFLFTTGLVAQGTRLLRQPDLGTDRIAFVYGADIWTADLNGGNVRRITSTPAVEANPHLSPDGQWLAFTSNRDGSDDVYVVPRAGGIPTRLTWHPADDQVRGWSPDGSRILFASTRESAPVPFHHLYTVAATGGPAERLSEQWGYDGSYSPDGQRLALDKMSRWDSEWRAYRGGQNTPLILLDLQTQAEVLLPNEKTTDIQPTWLGEVVYFLSDRDGTMNVWAYEVTGGELRQVTELTGSDIKWLSGNGSQLMVERDGYLHRLDPGTGALEQLNIEVIGDFPWAEPEWKDVSEAAGSVSLSPTGKRALMEARGEIFTVPTEKGDSRNLTRSAGTADRAPVWSPKGDRIAWFTDAGGNGYALHLADQTGRGDTTNIPIGASKMAWNPAWSPDGKSIAFVDDDVRIRVVDLATKRIRTVDTGTNNIDRGRTEPVWSPDSRYLAYVKSGSNRFRQIWVWDRQDNAIHPLTDAFADSFSPAWDRDGQHLYLLASTDLALGAGWANTSSMQADPNYKAYVVVLPADLDSPFLPESDEEEVTKESTDEEEETDSEEEENEADKADDSKAPRVVIDFDRVSRRTIALPVSGANYYATAAGPAGTLFLAEENPGGEGATLKKFTLKKREAKDFAKNVRNFAISADGEKILFQSAGKWTLAKTGADSGESGDAIKPELTMKLDRLAEWKQIFEEAYRYERDYFYDPGLHGRDWQAVYARYAPLVPYLRHREDLSYVLDQLGGELSVGHSFVFGGDMPETEKVKVGLLGADLTRDRGRWRIARIYTTESWNPNLSSPLDRPGLEVSEGTYLVGINGVELTAEDNPYRLLDGTVGKQTVLHLNDNPAFSGNREVVVEPIDSENALRQRAWVEDNRRMVDSLSGGRLAYVWVPNTGGSGFVNFNRYYFAQQDKEGAVIDERFNGGGLLDDYMVDLMTRSLRAALTNEVPDGNPFTLPAGILGPKALLINERAGSGGDFFPWAFRQQEAGPLIGATTWGGLVKSSVHYGFIDGGAMTAPDNAVFDPVAGEYIAENVGIAPDIVVRQDARSLNEGKDPQLQRAVEEVLQLLEKQSPREVKNPPYPRPALGDDRK
ncbi:tricorn protease [Lewinella marina]|uniref:Tricorn protease homolog n=1 Tax=Neolewinella marina TaxID=438751 RepID=A0A2G0CG99_9BACT|nr:S41 family peptidase [Neolewinella marina]NJB86559.1 tricorn protease [Neolewinella marina]PHK98988.1 protease [Neolewinella marina]